MLGTLLCSLAALGADTVFVSPQWLAERQGEPKLVILQIGSREEFERGHVPGARWADMMLFHDHRHAGALPPAGQMVEGLRRLGVSIDSRVILVADPIMAGLAYVALDYLGHGSATSVLDGGYAAWRAAGLPAGTATPAFEPGSFVPRLRAEVFATADWIAGRLADSGLRLLDARTLAEYAGTTGDEGLPRRGHIPGAVHLDWRWTLAGAAARDAGPERDNPEGGVLKPRGELEALFRAAAAGGRDVVAYCTVGMRASQLYLVTRHLGLRARVYLGSMSEWSQRPELPMIAGSSPR